MTDVECREFITQLIEKSEFYEERQPDGRWIKDIKFKIPMLNNETLFGLDNFNQLEICCLLERLRNAKDHVRFMLDMEDYYRIKDAEADKEKR